jgi:hypothetical protein
MSSTQRLRRWPAHGSLKTFGGNEFTALNIFAPESVTVAIILFEV